MSCEIKTPKAGEDATQERKVCDMEVEIVIFVVKESAQPTAQGFRSTGAKQSRKHSRRSPLRLRSQAQRDTTGPDNFQNMGH